MLELDFPFGVTIDLFAVAHILLAATVTVHVLLRKRDVRGAIGWIGIAWLSPVAGAVFYYALGINRVTRRASRLNRPGAPRKGVARAGAVPLDGSSLAENIATVAAVGQRVTGRPLAAGNALSILRGGDEAYPAMLDAIRGARRSIALASYIFRADRVGEAFIDALGEARSKKVEIRVLLDGIGSGYILSPATRRLAAAGIPVARFLHDWLPWRMPFLNMRSHKKLLIVDGAIGFTGGLNIGEENVLALRSPDPVGDVHFRVEGPVVSQLMLTFAEDWNFTRGEILDGDAWWPEIAPMGPVRARGIDSGPDEDMGKLEAVLATAIGEARRRLRIVTPYFLPDQRLMSGIALAALRGVEVDIVLPEHSDHIVLEWAMRAHLKFFMAPGVRVHLEPAPFDHSKLVTVDGAWFAVGSANWDVRSARLNFEFTLECYDEGAAAEIDRLIDIKIARSRRISQAELAQRPLPVQLRDAAARLLLPYL